MKNLGLSGHFYYKRIVKEIEEIDTCIEEYGFRKEWTMKSKALLGMI
jgi:hypothetical protein